MSKNNIDNIHMYFCTEKAETTILNVVWLPD